jgi:hypothetical protein
MIAILVITAAAAYLCYQSVAIKRDLVDIARTREQLWNDWRERSADIKPRA